MGEAGEVAEVGKVGEVAEVAEVAEVGEVAEVAEVGEVGEGPRDPRRPWAGTKPALKPLDGITDEQASTFSVPSWRCHSLLPPANWDARLWIPAALLSVAAAQCPVGVAAYNVAVV